VHRRPLATTAATVAADEDLERMISNQIATTSGFQLGIQKRQLPADAKLVGSSPR
jgi:hypothetical protein